MNSNPAHALIDSRSGFQDALRRAFDLAAEQGSNELYVCDVDYADWPLGERGVVAALTRWAYAHRKLKVLALHYEEVVRRHARWVGWRTDWAHVVECRAVAHLPPESIPRTWLAPGLHAVRVLDPLRWRGVIDSDLGELTRLAQNIDEVWQRSIPAFPATTLGL